MRKQRSQKAKKKAGIRKRKKSSKKKGGCLIEKENREVRKLKRRQALERAKQRCKKKK